MTGLSSRCEVQPVRNLLSDFDAELRPPSLTLACGAFVDHIPHALEQLRPVLHQPADAEKAAGLFIGSSQEDDIAVQCRLRSVERHKRRQVQDPARLRVECTAAVDISVLDLAGKRIGVPGSPGRGHHVHVVQEHQRRLIAALEPRPDVASPGRRFGRLVRDALCIEDRLEELHARRFIPRRVDRCQRECRTEATERPRLARQPRGPVPTQTWPPGATV